MTITNGCFSKRGKEGRERRDRAGALGGGGERERVGLGDSRV